MNILVVDDERDIARTLVMALNALGHQAETANNRQSAQDRLRSGKFDVAFLDLRLGSENGLEILPDLLAISPRLSVILVTAYSSIETAVLAMQRGASDYLPKPFKPSQIAQILERIEKNRHLETRISELEGQVDRSSHDDLASSDPAIQKLLLLAQKSASSDASILLLGETGTGKTALARQIHKWSERAKEPFVTVHCPSLSRDLLESELFGHIKGAFTGAVTTTQGKVAGADRGTLFLDEIGELPIDTQPKLLRLLQEKEYERVGEFKVRMADVRVIAATNRNLHERVQSGAFREDLLYRLDVISFNLPPLRERPADIFPLAESLLRQLASRAGRNIRGFTEQARRLIERYQWPGNIRELRNVIERAAILTVNDEIGAEDIPTLDDNSGRLHPMVGGPFSLEEIEAEHIRKVLSRTKSLQEAAAVLKLDPTTLLRKRKSLNLVESD